MAVKVQRVQVLDAVLFGCLACAPRVRRAVNALSLNRRHAALSGFEFIDSLGTNCESHRPHEEVSGAST